MFVGKRCSIVHKLGDVYIQMWEMGWKEFQYSSNVKPVWTPKQVFHMDFSQSQAHEANL